MKKIHVSVTNEMYEQMMDLIKSGRYTNVSELVRDAIRRLINGIRADEEKVE